ncbi:MAG: hypothetical protein Q9M50_03040 [Methylococcales bacterium]|nr:hypothetical protein [Methylococcales bacterium]
MLEKLIKKGIEKEFFKLSELGQLKSSCCPNSRLFVIDYDKAKEKIIYEEKDKELQEPKSADALKILPELNRVDFIELKGFKLFFKYDKGKNFDEKIKSFNLERKIIDSLFVLKCIIQNNTLHFTNEEKQEYHNAEKNYFIVVDIERPKKPIEDRLISLIFLSLKKTVNNIPTSSLDKLNKSKLFTCTEIDNYYQQLLNEKK